MTTSAPSAPAFSACFVRDIASSVEFEPVPAITGIFPFDSLIHSYQDHNGYDREKYPLGLFTREYYKSEADFAQEKLDELLEINLDVLPETDKISAELLKFVLEDKIAYYEFERFLNPDRNNSTSNLSVLEKSICIPVSEQD